MLSKSICLKPGCHYPVFSRKYCKNHQYLRPDYKRPTKRYYSKKGAAVNRRYSPLSKEFLEDQPICAIRSPECTGLAEGVHHIKGRGKLLLDKSKWLPACNRCNSYVESHHQWAVDNGFKESRLT